MKTRDLYPLITFIVLAVMIILATIIFGTSWLGERRAREKLNITIPKGDTTLFITKDSISYAIQIHPMNIKNNKQ